ncbi:hypothetical protein HFO94_08455 [Rhizobium leguminosarum]|jgi:hypothetical protein|uniref:hypothetical protein n=1 Tax=Rhizobium TaxID=379 RepID=UPI00102F7983|nr:MULTISPECIES: hypothetical protein [Rhizobium]TBY67119.1 hypothetical protein E0H46_19535 [Rhizobium leguminosarum bv. viciae]MBY5353571.1 hypothetical protein [Rhizobium leguminosarum]NEH82932.1 hypothetical protein [Rhizobium ruizarguesonis]TAU26742.1 hypothetical protein ELI48_11620 [Rhizobium ruizarguesonis]TAU68395.1 hypothetical protein ELI45_11515 [Rhizobium ruizarguesonis]
MTYREVLDNKSIAVSTSESPDMPGLGLQAEHLRDAMTEIARHTLALGAKLVYGGDLRTDGFSNLLFELAARYRRDTINPRKLGVTNYLAWPVHIRQEPEQLDQASADLEGVAELRLLDINGKDLDLKERHNLKTHQPTEPEWALGLSSMRHKMLAETDARIILGGRVDKFMGDMPGIAEEALYSLQAKQPLYVMGGFGGCARDVAEEIGVLEPNSVREWPGRDKFNSFKGKKLNNGLSAEENRVLASTPHVDQAIVLILRGLTKANLGSQGGMTA